MQDKTTIYTELTDEELIRLTQDRDESALTELMSRFSPHIWKGIIANSRSRCDAEEILMDVWRSVWENIKGLQNPGSLAAWLGVIAYNACKRYYNSRKYSNHVILCSDVFILERINQDSITHFNKTELHQTISEALHQLPDKLLRIAELYYLEMWSITEIHVELGLAIGTIKTRLRQARELLRKEFGVEPKIGGTMIQKQDETTQTQTRTRLIGVGAAGSNAVQRMVDVGMTDVESYVVNTDQQALEKCKYGIHIQIGQKTTEGLGCKANPEIGKLAAEENIQTLQKIVENTEMVFIIAGMGGGTGTGVAPVIASLSQEQGAITVGVVTYPFDFEGERYHQRAQKGLEDLRKYTDAVVVIQNQSLLKIGARQMNIREAFSLSDKAILQGVECFSSLYSNLMK
ncbi:sigma-70 family RNA polymerase sigma factor [Candidatus Poribacteria bacterium]|nr:sigma-70 family RNA polymerase sigma factor [Candidatus Poribacteria bacterium]